MVENFTGKTSYLSRNQPQRLSTWRVLARRKPSIGQTFFGYKNRLFIIFRNITFATSLRLFEHRINMRKSREYFGSAEHVWPNKFRLGDLVWHVITYRSLHPLS